MIEIEDYPFPPSENSIYSHNGRYRFANKLLINYQNECKIWFYVNNPSVKFIREFVKGKKIKITATFFYEYSMVYTKYGSVKKQDVTNRVKCFLDCLCQMLDIDDSTVFEFTAIKAICPSDKKKHVKVRIEEYA